MKIISSLPPFVKRGKSLLFGVIVQRVPRNGKWLELSLKEFQQLAKSHVRTLQNAKTIIWNSQNNPRGWLRRQGIKLNVAVNTQQGRLYLQRKSLLKQENP